MSDDLDVKKIIDVRNGLVQVFNEALQTHGAAITYAGTVAFAASAVHQGEHLTNGANARVIVLGRWTANFHAHLEMLNEQCDAGADPLKGMKPAGMA